MGPRNKCGDDNLRDSFLKLAPMGLDPGLFDFADNNMLQHIDLARVPAKACPGLDPIGASLRKLSLKLSSPHLLRGPTAQ